MIDAGGPANDAPSGRAALIWALELSGWAPWRLLERGTEWILAPKVEDSPSPGLTICRVGVSGESGQPTAIVYPGA